jgi:hypothetical protein
VIAWALLIEGASWNTNVVRETETAPFCPYLKDGIFAGAAVLTLAATALGLTSYIMLQRQPLAAVEEPAGGTQSKPPPAGVATGHPVFPQPSMPQKLSEAEDPPTAAQPQEYREATQSPQSSPPAAGNNGSHYFHAPNQEFPAQGRPADHTVHTTAAALPAVASSAPSEAVRPGDLRPPPLRVGVADQPVVVPLPLPQAYIRSCSYYGASGRHGESGPCPFLRSSKAARVRAGYRHRSGQSRSKTGGAGGGEYSLF